MKMSYRVGKINNLYEMVLKSYPERRKKQPKTLRVRKYLHFIEDAKKDAKKVGKIEVEEEEGVKEVEKEYKKAIDMINFLHQFPLDEIELLEMSN